MIPSFLRMLSLIICSRRCAGCGRKDAVLCNSCMQYFDDSYTRDIAPTLRVLSCACYQGPVRQAILSWKDHGDEELDLLFASLLAVRCVDAIEHYDEEVSWCIVPAPSSQSSLRRRGRAHMHNVAQLISRMMNAYSRAYGLAWSAHVCDAVGMTPQVHKAVTANDRHNRLHRLDKGLRLCATHSMAHAQVILIDDIVTTGSTMRACIRFLRSHHAQIVVACCLADVREQNADA